MQLQNLKHNQNNLSLNFSLRSFFRAYLNAFETKAIFFSYPLLESRASHMFLACLEKEARIAGYHFIKKNKTVDIFLSYPLAEKTPLSLRFFFYSFKGRKRMVSVKLLQQFHNQNPTAFTLINTTFGFLTLKECLQKKCGGEFLITIS